MMTSTPAVICILCHTHSDSIWRTTFR